MARQVLASVFDMAAGAQTRYDCRTAAFCVFRDASRFFSRLRAALTTVLVSGAALCASAAEVTVGYVDLMEPGFFSQTVMSALTAVAQERKDDRVHSLRLSPMIALQEIRQRRPDIVIAPAEIYINLATEIGAHPIAMRKTRYAKDPAKSVAVQSLCGPIGRSCRHFRI